MPSVCLRTHGTVDADDTDDCASPSGVMRQRRVAPYGQRRLVTRDLLWLRDERLGLGADFPALRGREGAALAPFAERGSPPRL